MKLVDLLKLMVSVKVAEAEIDLVNVADQVVDTVDSKDVDDDRDPVAVNETWLVFDVVMVFLEFVAVGLVVALLDNKKLGDGDLDTAGAVMVADPELVWVPCVSVKLPCEKLASSSRLRVKVLFREPLREASAESVDDLLLRGCENDDEMLVDPVRDDVFVNVLDEVTPDRDLSEEEESEADCCCEMVPNESVALGEMLSDMVCESVADDVTELSPVKDRLDELTERVSDCSKEPCVDESVEVFVLEVLAVFVAVISRVLDLDKVKVGRPDLEVRDIVSSAVFVVEPLWSFVPDPRVRDAVGDGVDDAVNSPEGEATVADISPLGVAFVRDRDCLRVADVRVIEVVAVVVRVGASTVGLVVPV